MKSLLLIILLTCFQQVVLAGDGVTLNKKNITLDKVISTLKKQAGYTFWYNSVIVRNARKINISVKNASIKEVMDICVAGQPFTYEVINKIIILKADTAIINKMAADELAVMTRKNKRAVAASENYQNSNPDRSVGSVSSVDGSQLNQNSGNGGLFANTSVNGLQTQTDASGNTSMLVRGRSSLNGGTEPLVLLDGIPYSGDIKQINPSTIENIKVLKDGSETAMYGSRGGNGVIVITTKKAAVVNGAPADGPTSITWKEGYTIYDEANVAAILRNVGKVNHLEVEYKRGIPAGNYSGEIPDNISFASMVEVLKASGINFIIEKSNDSSKGDKIIVN